MREYVAAADGTWLCRCDNTPDQDGFVPVTRRWEVHPASPRWRGRYCCLRCGRLVLWPTREIVGQIALADLALHDHHRTHRRPRFPHHPPRKGQTTMDNDNPLTLDSWVLVPVGNGEIRRYGRIADIDGEVIVVDLGRDGTLTLTRQEIIML